MTITESNGTFTFAATDTNTDTHYTNYLQIKGNGTEAVKFTQNADKSLNLKPGTNVSISAASGEITISSTDTNTSHSHSVGVGLVGSGSAGTSGTYTYKAKLRSETALTVDSAAATTTSGRVYPVAVDKSGYLSVNVPWTDTTYTFNGAVSTIKDSNLTVNRALISNSSGKVAVSDITSTELSYLDGVSSNIQTQLNNKVDKVSGKGLSTNDLTNALKTAYDDANSKKHTHANKDILDATEESFTTDLKGTYDGYNGLIQGLNNRVAIYSNYTSDITESMSFSHTQLQSLQSLFTVVPNAQIIRFYYGNANLRSFIDFNVSIHVTSSDTTITLESPKLYTVLLSGKRDIGGKIENVLMCFSYSYVRPGYGYSDMTFNAIGIEEEGTY